MIRLVEMAAQVAVVLWVIFVVGGFCLCCLAEGILALREKTRAPSSQPVRWPYLPNVCHFHKMKMIAVKCRELICTIHSYIVPAGRRPGREHPLHQDVQHPIGIRRCDVFEQCGRDHLGLDDEEHGEDRAFEIKAG